jgi:hypothetical protein
MQHSIVLDQLVPVPVEHNVEVIAINRTLAVVIDRTTGIEYVPSTIATSQLGGSEFDAQMYVEQLPASRLGGPRVKGRVVACRVVTHAGRGLQAGYVTRLVLDDGRG